MHFQEFKKVLSSRIASAQKPGVFRLTRISRDGFSSLARILIHRFDQRPTQPATMTKLGHRPKSLALLVDFCFITYRSMEAPHKNGVAPL